MPSISTANIIAPPEPALTPETMLARAVAMRETLRARQARCEELGRLPEDTNQDFLDAGFYRIIQPRMFGGYEFSLPDFVRVMTEVSRGCVESGWVLALTAGHPAAFISSFPEQGQYDTYGASGDCRAPGVALPGGMAMPVEGGYHVKGTWNYASGCDIATHFLGGIIAADPEGQPSVHGFVLLRRDQFTINNNWNVWGMQGTGSRQVVADVTIPNHRFLEIGDIKRTRGSAMPGRKLHANPLYHGDITSLLIFEEASVMLGAARQAIDLYEQILLERKLLFPPFTPRWEVPEYQNHFGRAMGLADTAEAALLHLAGQYEEHCRRKMQDGIAFTPEAARRLHRATEQTIELSWEAVELLFRTGGSASCARGSMLGRCYRNTSVIRTHQTLQSGHTETNAARLHFGLPALTPL